MTRARPVPASLGELKVDGAVCRDFDVQLDGVHGNLVFRGFGSWWLPGFSSEALLWQSGYLTLTGSRRIGARLEHSLGYPNLEVESALNAWDWI